MLKRQTPPAVILGWFLRVRLRGRSLGRTFLFDRFGVGGPGRFFFVYRSADSLTAVPNAVKADVVP